MIKKFLVGVVITVALILGAVGAFKHQVPSVKVGGTSPDFSSQFIDWGGIFHWSLSTTNLIQASSTVCEIQSPNATTTLSQFAIRFVLASTSATSVTETYGATQNSTTNALGSAYAVAASAQATVVASSTTASLGDKLIIAPNQWLSAIITTSGSNVGNAPIGTCQTEFVQIN